MGKYSNFHSMAEATIMLVLAGLYDLNGSQDQLKSNWLRKGGMRATMLMGKTVGLIGLGQIARAVAERLRNWNVNIQAYAPQPISPIPDFVTLCDLEYLLRTSDVVCVLASLNSASHRLLNAENLRLIKPEAVLVNTARGGADRRAGSL